MPATCLPQPAPGAGRDGCGEGNAAGWGSPGSPTTSPLIPAPVHAWDGWSWGHQGPWSPFSPSHPSPHRLIPRPKAGRMGRSQRQVRIPWHGQDRGAMQGTGQAPPAQPQPRTPGMLQGGAAPGMGSPFPAKNLFSREGKWSTETGAMHPPAQGRGGLKARGPLGIGVAVLP